MLERECKYCKQIQPIENFKMTETYRIYKCYDCRKEDSNRHNHNIKKVIKEWAGDCWWVEAFCYASLFYYGKNKRR